MIEQNLLMNHSPVLLAIDFNVPFGTNEEIRNLMFRYYYAWEMVWPNETLMAHQLQNRADLNREYWTHIWETTRYDYDPIENYNRYEEYTDIENNTGNSNSVGSADTSQYPMTTGGAKKVTSGADKTTTDTTNDRRTNHTAHLHGNIGVTTTQEMIEQERRITLRLMEDYIRDFSGLFMLTI